MCHWCDDYADQAEADRDVKPDNAIPTYIPWEQSSRDSVRCEGCGERIQYLDLYRKVEVDGLDQWWHQDCDPDGVESSDGPTSPSNVES